MKQLILGFALISASARLCHGAIKEEDFFQTGGHEDLLRRNLQSAEMGTLNQLLQNVELGIVGTLTLPELLGATPTITDLSCNSLSIGGLGAQQENGQLRLSMEGLTISCQADIGFAKDGQVRDITIAFDTGNGLGLSLATESVAGQGGQQTLGIADGGCDLSLRPNVKIVKNEDTGFFAGLLIGVANGLVGALTPAISGLLGGILCSVVEDFGPLDLVPPETATTISTSAFLKDITDVTTENKQTWFDYKSFEEEKTKPSHLYQEALAEGLDPMNDALLDFSRSELFSFASDFLNKFLGQPGTGTNANRLVINQAAEKIAIALGDASGNKISLDSLLAAFPPLPLSFGGLDISVGLKSAAIRGGNTFQAFDMLRANLDAKTTLNNKLALQNAGIDISLDLGVTTPNGEVLIALPAQFGLPNTNEVAELTDESGNPIWTTQTIHTSNTGGSTGPKIRLAGLPPIQDTFSLTLDLSNLAVDAALMLAIDTNVLGRIPVGGLMNENIFDTIECLSTALYAVQFPTLGMSLRLPGNFIDIDSTNLPGVMNFASGAVNTLAGVLINGQDIGPLVSGLLQQVLNSLLGRLTTGSSVEESCNNVASPFFVNTGKRMSGDLADLLPIPLDFLLNDFLGPSGDLGFNRMAQIVTEDQSGVKGLIQINGYSFAGKLSDFGLSSDATISLTGDLSVSNLTTIGDDTKLLQSPGTPLNVKNVFVLQGPMRLGAEIQMDIEGSLFQDGKAMSNAISFEIELGRVGAESLALLRLNVEETFKKTIAELTDPRCPLQNIGQFAILDMDVQNFLDNMKVKLRCSGSCSTTTVDQLGAYLARPEVMQGVNSYIKAKLVPFVEQVVSDKETWSLFDSEVLQGPLGDCSFITEPVEGSTLFVVIGLGVGGFVIGSSILFVAYFYRLHRKNLTQQQNTQQNANWRMSMAMIFRREMSLAGHGETSALKKFGVPIAALLTLIFFALGLIKTVDTTISVQVSYTDGQTEKISPNLNTTGVGLDPNSLVNILVEGNAFLLVGAIGIFSGVLPFVWILSLLFAWFSPTTILSVKRRGKIILFYSGLGKWTLLFPMLLVIITAAIRFNFGVSDTPDSENPIVALDIFLTPSWGLLLFCFAVVCGMALNKVVLFHHRKIIRFDGQATNSNYKHRDAPNRNDYVLFEAVKDHVFRFNRNGGDDFFRVNTLGKYLTGFGVLLTILAVWLGHIIPSHSFEINGVAGAFIGELVNTEFNIFKMVAALQSTVAVQADGFFKVLFSVGTEACLVFLVFVAPTFAVAVLGYLWYRPLTYERQATYFEWSEIINSFSSLDVYLATIALVSLQINTTLVQAVMGIIAPLSVVCGYDANGEVPLVRSANQAGLTKGATNCLELDIAPMGGFFVLALAVIAKFFLYHSVMRTSYAAIEDRQLQATGSFFRTEAMFDKDSTSSRLTAWFSTIAGCFVPAAANPGAMVSPSNHASGSRLEMGGGYYNGEYPQQGSTNPRYKSGGSTGSGSRPVDLPPGWSQHLDRTTGRFYYSNTQGLVTWNPPM